MNKQYDIKRINRFFIKVAIAEVVLLTVGLLELIAVFASHSAGDIGFAMQSIMILVVAIPGLGIVASSWLSSFLIVKKLAGMQLLIEPAAVPIVDSNITVGTVYAAEGPPTYTFETFNQNAKQLNSKLLTFTLATILLSTAVLLFVITNHYQLNNSAMNALRAIFWFAAAGCLVGLNASLMYWLRRLKRDQDKSKDLFAPTNLPVVLIAVCLIIVGVVYVTTDTGIAGKNTGLRVKIESVGVQYYVPSSKSNWSLDKSDRSFFVNNNGSHTVATYYATPKDPLLFYAAVGAAHVSLYKDTKNKLSKNTSTCGAEPEPCSYLLTTPDGTVVLYTQNDSVKTINSNTYYFQKGTTMFEFMTSFSYGPGFISGIVQMPNQNLASFVDSLQEVSNKEIASKFAYDGKPIVSQSSDSKAAITSKDQAYKEVVKAQLQNVPFNVYLPSKNATYYKNQNVPLPEINAGYQYLDVNIGFPNQKDAYSLVETKVSRTAVINSQTTKCVIVGDKSSLDDMGAKELIEPCSYLFTSAKNIRVYKYSAYHYSCTNVTSIPADGSCTGTAKNTLEANDYFFQIGNTYVYFPDNNLIWDNTTLYNLVDSLVQWSSSDLVNAATQKN